jgi:hypothetical protein
MFIQSTSGDEGVVMLPRDFLDRGKGESASCRSDAAASMAAALLDNSRLWLLATLCIMLPESAPPPGIDTPRIEGARMEEERPKGGPVQEE